MSLFSQYIQERTDRQVIETEHGFATYTFLPDLDTVYLEDIYVSPEHRKSGLASEITNEIVEIARKKGCRNLLGSVVPGAKGSTDGLKAFLAYGMQLKSCDNNMIWLIKDIR